MILKAQGKFIDTSPIERLLTEGEKYSDVINFSLPKINNGIDISDCIFTMRTVAATGEMTEGILTSYIEDSNIIAAWYPSEAITAVPGMLNLELIGSKGSERIIKYKMPAIYVKEAVMGEGLPVPDVIEEKLAQMNETLAKASVIKAEYETLRSEAADLQRRAEELAVQIGVSSEYAEEIIRARNASKSYDIYATLSARLESDFEKCIDTEQLDAAIQEALGTAETNLSEVVNLPDGDEEATE